MNRHYSNSARNSIGNRRHNRIFCIRQPRRASTTHISGSCRAPKSPFEARLHPAPSAIIIGSTDDDDKKTPQVGGKAPIVNRISAISCILVVFLQQSHRLTRSSTFHALQEWEGYVVQIDVDAFVARLVDLTAGSSVEEEEAVIPLAEIADYDAERIRLGSIFRWVIGYEHSPTRRKRVSQIVFRDRPAITYTDVNDGVAWAEEVIRSLDL